MDSSHHRHASTASQTQQQTLSSSSSGVSSPVINPMPSTGAVPTTTAGPITISLVVALTLVICMILNCGKLKRRVNPQRYNSNVQQQQHQQQQQQHQHQQQQKQGLQETVIVDEKNGVRQDTIPPSKGGSPWSSSSTLLTPHAPAYMPSSRQPPTNSNNIPPHIISHPRR